MSGTKGFRDVFMGAGYEPFFGGDDLEDMFFNPNFRRMGEDREKREASC